MVDFEAEPRILAGSPSTFSACERQAFIERVAAAGEVSGVALATNVAGAKALGLLFKHDLIVGGAALKRPQASYRARVSAEANVDLPISRVPYELGYVFIEPALQGRGLSHALVAAVLNHADGAGVFATARTDNVAMRATLARVGFRSAGSAYMGRDQRELGLLIHQGI